MNYICQLNGFRRWRGQHALPPFAQLLWYTLTLEQNNRLWPEHFKLSSATLRQLMGGIGINTLRRARNELIEAELIEAEVAKYGGEVTQYHMTMLYEEEEAASVDPLADPIPDPSADRSEGARTPTFQPPPPLLKPQNLKTTKPECKPGRCSQDGGSLGCGLAQSAEQAAAIRQSVAGSSRTGVDWQAEPLYGL
jgi:hypothetical protein